MRLKITSCSKTRGSLDSEEGTARQDPKHAAGRATCCCKHELY
ncbi:unnamed protein product [Moneuplotes crassus]|uniref:Uncharacterized protein n=1 Tax=Euplotes crassus TaxID=5936 RepID=A0AAD1XQG0_EUPCR|nr:unnamed protein product [Moneuplotes crassus]